MKKTRNLDLKRAKVMYEDNLDRWKRPTSSGGSSAYVVERIIDSQGKLVRRKTRSSVEAESKS
jgi:hypothetical protein